LGVPAEFELSWTGLDWQLITALSLTITVLFLDGQFPRLNGAKLPRFVPIIVVEPEASGHVLVDDPNSLSTYYSRSLPVKAPYRAPFYYEC
jgi:hypothetical protein